MEKELLEFLVSQGGFALLFLYLLLYVLKENSKREKEYQKMIAELLISFPNMKKDIEDIKNKLKN